MTQRGFIVAGAAATLGGRLYSAADAVKLECAPCPAARGDSHPPRLAFQVYAVRDMCVKDFEGMLKEAKSLGYESVEADGAKPVPPAGACGVRSSLDYVKGLSQGVVLR